MEYIVGCLSASLTSAYYMPVMLPSCGNEKGLQTLPKIPQRVKLPLVEDHYYWNNQNLELGKTRQVVRVSHNVNNRAIIPILLKKNLRFKQVKKRVVVTQLVI